MVDVNQAAAHAKNLGKQFRGVMEVAEVLEEIGNLENAQAEAEKNTHTAREAIAKAVDEREQAVDALVHAQEKVQVARDEAARVTQAAETEASEAVSSAGIRIAAMVAEGQKQVDTLKRTTAAAEVAHEAFMGRIITEEKAAQQELDKVRAQLDALLKRIGGDDETVIDG